MLIGIPREVRNHEFRVGTIPEGMRAMVSAGHEVLVDPDRTAGLQTCAGKVTHQGLAQDLELPYTAPEQALP